MWRGIARLGVCAAGIAAAIFTVCAAGVALAPPARTSLLGYLLDTQLSGLPQSVTWSRFLGAMLIWTAGSTLLAVIVAWSYRRLFPPERPALGTRLTLVAGPMRRFGDWAPAGSHCGMAARPDRPPILIRGLHVSKPPARPGRRPYHHAG